MESVFFALTKYQTVWLQRRTGERPMRVRLEKNGSNLLLDGQPIARGGEAAIYPISDRRALLAKVSHAPTPEQADKLAAMIANPPADPTAKQGHTSIAWPTDRLFDAEAEG